MHRPGALWLGAPYNMVSRYNIGYQLASGSFQGLDLIIVAGIGPVATDNLQTITARPRSSSLLHLPLSLSHTHVSVDETIKREDLRFRVVPVERNITIPPTARRGKDSARYL